MKYNDSDFERYLSGKMIEDEKIKFESDLLLSSELDKNFKSYKKIYELILETKSIKLNENYSSDILMRFRNNLESGKSDKPFFKIGAFITASASLVMGFILTLNVFIKDAGSNMDLANVVENEKDLIINSFDFSDKFISGADSKSIEIMDSIYKEALADNITLESEFDEINSNAIDFDELDFEKYISDEEIDQIYASLINKDIL